MREFKFRGQRVGSDLKNHELVYGDLIHDGSKWFISNLNGATRTYYSIDKESVGQFTGLKDKNGVEIYEGDIFRIEEDGTIECDFCDGVGTVEGGKTIETTCTRCNGTGICEGNNDRILYIVITWVKEWCMFASLSTQEYKDYQDRGIKSLDEPMFWTYTLEDTNSRKHFLCGNIHQNESILNEN